MLRECSKELYMNQHIVPARSFCPVCNNVCLCLISHFCKCYFRPFTFPPRVYDGVFTRDSLRQVVALHCSHLSVAHGEFDAMVRQLCGDCSTEADSIRAGLFVNISELLLKLVGEFGSSLA